MFAEWSNVQRNNCQVLYGMLQVPGSNLARDYDIDHSESEMACHYSNSRALSGSCTAFNIELGNEETQLTKLLKPIRTHDPDQNPPQSYTASPCQVQVSRHHCRGPNTGSNSRGGGIKKYIEQLVVVTKHQFIDCYGH